MDLQHDLHQPQTSKPSYDRLWAIIVELRALTLAQAEIIKKQAETIRLQAEEIKLLKKKLYGSSSERGKGSGSGGPGGVPKGDGDQKPKPKSNRKRMLSEQYPNAEIQDKHITFNYIPMCSCCNKPMVDSGLDEVTEQLHTIPAKTIIIRQHRHKYRCAAGLSGLTSALLPPRIAPGSSLGDTFIMGAAVSKFLYLIPSERYAMMVAQSGFNCFAPQLVLAAQHYCADFLRPVYRALKREVQRCVVLFADETPHRMLEGEDSDKTWYLWGFTGGRASYFEIHNTRSGAVAIKFLAESECRFLVTDVYSGYIRAVREANVIRRAKGLPEIIMLYCNSHSRRRFTEAAVSYPDEAQFFIEQYAHIYRLDRELKLLVDPIARMLKRAEMKVYFEAMSAKAQVLRETVSDKSSLAKAIDYFLGNYEGLTQFLKDARLPIDNNLSERQLRSPVVGRKTWLGTHSERGAETTEILFTIFQSCKLAKVDGLQYLSAVVEALLNGDPPFTPQEYLFTLIEVKAAA